MSIKAIATVLNLVIIIGSLSGTFALIKKLKFDDNNSRIIFLLYIVYWMSPLLCRDYTASMHITMGLKDAGKLMWIPIAAFGFVGIFWRPLNDIITYRLKSRKLIIYISLLIQLLTILPFMIYPCFATNIVQSVGCGVGASGIGLFNLMFNENQQHHKKFLTISLFALPPIIAAFIVSAIESFIACFANSDDPTKYASSIWYIWLVALIFILIAFVITYFIKEKRATLYQDKQYKEPVVKKSGHWKVALLCICGVCLAFMRWATAGPYAGLQLSFIAENKGVSNTNLWEGYVGLVYSFGCLLGTIISAIPICKAKGTKYQPIIVGIAIGLFIIYLGLTCSFVNVPMYFWMLIVNGIAFGMMWNIFMLLVLSRFYKNRDVLTPIGMFNMSLSIGITLGSMFVGLTKAKYFDFYNTPAEERLFDKFLKSNQTTSLLLLIIAIVLLLLFVGYYILQTKVRVGRKEKEKSIAMIGENEL